MPFFEDFMTLEFIQNMIGLQIITTSYKFFKCVSITFRLLEIRDERVNQVCTRVGVNDAKEIYLFFHLKMLTHP